MKSELRPSRANGTARGATCVRRTVAYKPASAIIITPRRIANQVGELVQNDEAA